MKRREIPIRKRKIHRQALPLKRGISHAVILATDTDPRDVDRPEIIEKLRMNYSRLGELFRPLSFLCIASFKKNLGEKLSFFNPKFILSIRGFANWRVDFAIFIRYLYICDGKKHQL